MTHRSSFPPQDTRSMPAVDSPVPLETTRLLLDEVAAVRARLREATALLERVYTAHAFEPRSDVGRAVHAFLWPEV